MNTLLNHDNKAASIEVSTGYDSTEKKEIFTSKTWTQLTDSDKQNIASNWIKDHVYCNVNQVMELLAQNDDHCDFDEYQNIAEYQDFDETSGSHINDLTIDELIVLAEDLDVDHVELFRTKYLDDLIENTNNTTFIVQDCYNELEITFSLSLEKTEDEYNQQEIEKELISFFGKYKEDHFSFDDLDTCITELGINFDGYLKAYQSDLADLIVDEIDLAEYGQDNSLDPEYQQAYEFWSVSDHFVSMLNDSSECSNDILGLKVWARYCTGQGIVLDHQIQVAAFKVLSDCSYTSY